MQGELKNLYVDTGAWRVLYIDNMCCSQILARVWILKEHYFDSWIDPALDQGSKVGTVVRALASHQSGPSSNPGVDAICGLSLLLVLSFAPRGFSPGTPVFPSPQKPTLSNSNSIWNARTRLNEFIWTLKCFVGKKAIYNFFFLPWSNDKFMFIVCHSIPDSPRIWTPCMLQEPLSV